MPSIDLVIIRDVDVWNIKDRLKVTTAIEKFIDNLSFTSYGDSILTEHMVLDYVMNETKGHVNPKVAIQIINIILEGIIK